MTDQCFDLYGDLNEFGLEQKLKEKNEDYLKLEKKYENALKTIEHLQKEIKDLKTTIETISKNFSSLLLTARAEIKRKDAQITALRKEKDDICFRRLNRFNQPHHIKIVASSSTSYLETRNNEFENEHRNFELNKKCKINPFAGSVPRTKEFHSTSNKEIASTPSLSFHHDHKKRVEYGKYEDSRRNLREDSSRRRKSAYEDRVPSLYRNREDFRKDEVKQSDESKVRKLKRKHEDKSDGKEDDDRNPKKIRRDVNYEDKNGIKMIRVEITENRNETKNTTEARNEREGRRKTEKINEEEKPKKSITYSEYKSIKAKTNEHDLRKKIMMSHEKKGNEQSSTIERQRTPERRILNIQKPENLLKNGQELKKTVKCSEKLKVLSSEIEIESEILKDIETMKENQETSKAEGTLEVSMDQKDAERCSKLIRESLEDALFNDDVEYERISEIGDKQEQRNMNVDIYDDLTMSPVLDVGRDDLAEEFEHHSEIEETCNVNLGEKVDREKDEMTEKNRNEIDVRAEDQESKPRVSSEKKTVELVQGKATEIKDKTAEILESDHRAKYLGTEEITPEKSTKDLADVHRINRQTESEQSEVDSVVLEQSTEKSPENPVENCKTEGPKKEEADSEKLVDVSAEVCSKKIQDEVVKISSQKSTELISFERSKDVTEVVHSEIEQEETDRASMEIKTSDGSVGQPEKCTYKKNLENFENQRLLCTEAMTDSESSISTTISTVLNGQQENVVEVENKSSEDTALNQPDIEMENKSSEDAAEKSLEDAVVYQLDAENPHTNCFVLVEPIVVKNPTENIQSTVPSQTNELQSENSQTISPLDTKITSNEKRLSHDSISNIPESLNNTSTSEKPDNFNENKRKRTPKKSSSSLVSSTGRCPKMIGHQIEGFEPGWPGQKILEASKLKSALFQDVLNPLSVCSKNMGTVRTQIENESGNENVNLEELEMFADSTEGKKADGTATGKSENLTKLVLQIRKIKFSEIGKLEKKNNKSEKKESKATKVKSAVDQKVKKTPKRESKSVGGSGVLKRKRGRPRIHPLPNQVIESEVNTLNQEMEDQLASKRVVEEIDPLEETIRAVNSILIRDENDEIVENYPHYGDLKNEEKIHENPDRIYKTPDEMNQEMIEEPKNLVESDENLLEKVNESVQEVENEVGEQVEPQAPVQTGSVDLGGEENHHDHDKDGKSVENEIFPIAESALLNKSDSTLSQSIPKHLLSISFPSKDVQSSIDQSDKESNPSSSEHLQCSIAENNKESVRHQSFNSEQIEELVKNSKNDDELFDQVFRSPLYKSTSSSLSSHHHSPGIMNVSDSIVNTSRENEYRDIEKNIEQMFENSRVESVENSPRTRTEESNKQSLESSLDNQKQSSVADVDSRHNEIQKLTSPDSEKENISSDQNGLDSSIMLSQNENSLTDNFVDNSCNLNDSSSSNKGERKIFSNSFSDYVMEAGDNNVINVFITRKKRKIKKKKSLS